MNDALLDCKGLKCPEPIMRLCIAVKEMGSDQELTIEATDLAFEPDLRAWADMTGNEIVWFEEGPTKRARVRKTDP